MKDGCQGPEDCPDGWTCNQVTGECVSGGTGGEGDLCFEDADCDPKQSLRCDNAWVSLSCILMGSSLEFPSFKCWTTCSLLEENCNAGYECKCRLPFFGALCLPAEPATDGGEESDDGGIDGGESNQENTESSDGGLDGNNDGGS